MRLSNIKLNSSPLPDTSFKQKRKSGLGDNTNLNNNTNFLKRQENNNYSYTPASFYLQKNNPSFGANPALETVGKHAKKGLAGFLKTAANNRSLFEGMFVFGIATTIRPATIGITPAKKADKNYAKAWALASGAIGLALSVVIYKPVSKVFKNYMAGAAKKQYGKFIKNMHFAKTGKKDVKFVQTEAKAQYSEFLKNMKTPKDVKFAYDNAGRNKLASKVSEGSKVASALLENGMDSLSKSKKELKSLIKDVDPSKVKQLKKDIKEAPNFEVLSESVSKVKEHLKDESTIKELETKINFNKGLESMKKEVDNIERDLAKEGKLNKMIKIAKDQGGFDNGQANELYRFVKKGDIKLYTETAEGKITENKKLLELFDLKKETPEETKKAVDEAIEFITIKKPKALNTELYSENTKEIIGEIKKSLNPKSVEELAESKMGRVEELLIKGAEVAKAEEKDGFVIAGTKGGKRVNDHVNYATKFIVAPLQAWALMTTVKPLVKKLFKKDSTAATAVTPKLTEQQKTLFDKVMKGGKV